MRLRSPSGLAPLALLAAIALARPAAAQGARLSGRDAQPAKATLAIVGGYLIDGHDGPPIDNSVVLIDGKEIVAVGTVDSLKVPAGAKIVDASGYTVMPGLINVHVHLDLIGHSDYNVWHQKYVPGSAEYGRVCEVGAHQLIMGGVTTAVDLAGHPDSLKAVRDRINRGEIPGPRLLLSMGWIWHTTPEVAAANHRFNHTFNVHGADEARAAALKTIAMGADILKLWNGSTAEEVRAVAEEAHKKGLKVTGHSSGDQDTLARIGSGQDGIEHMGFNPDNPEMIRALLSHRTVVDPTPGVHVAGVDAVEWPQWRNDPRARAVTPPDMWLEIRNSLEYVERLPYFGRAYQPGSLAKEGQAVKTLYDAGVQLVLGTDSGTPANFHVDSTWRQMDFYVRAGIPAMKVIAMATRLSASWLGRGDKLGTIEPGRFADIIVVDGNPLVDMRLLKDPVYVFRDGVQYKGPSAASAVRKTSSSHE
jgi:imidazolonepropionase-like amidohydrolase